jgi:cytoskeleton protein RodZ
MADMLTLNSGKSVRSDSPAKQERGRGGRNAAPIPVQSIGPLLRERREAMGVTLAEAEVATRIRQKYLAALEADEWDLLPGEVVGRGFLRNYSTYLGLEPTEMIERRRAVADDSLAAVLVNTSAGSALPPERKVDYRPKDVALKDEGDDLDAPRQINWAPFLTFVALAAFLGLSWWLITSLGSQMGDMLASGRRQFSEWQAAQAQTAQVQSTPRAAATLPPNLTAGEGQASGQDSAQLSAQAAAAPAGDAAASGAASAVADAAAATATAVALFQIPAAPADPAAAQPTPVPAGAVPADPAAAAAEAAAPPAEEPLSLADLLPAPTPASAVVAPPEAAPAQPAAVAAAVVNAAANLRGGPSTDYPILAGLPLGQAVTITGRSADSTWYQLSDGSWLFAELVDNAPADLPVVEAPPLPAPAEAAPAEAAPAAP